MALADSSSARGMRGSKAGMLIFLNLFWLNPWVMMAPEPYGINHFMESDYSSSELLFLWGSSK